MTDIVERLHRWAAKPQDNRVGVYCDCLEAAAEIEKLRADFNALALDAMAVRFLEDEIEKLRDALRFCLPYADIHSLYPQMVEAARTALGETKG